MGMRSGWILVLVSILSVRAAGADQVIKTIPVGNEPSFSVSSADGTRVYVANGASASVSVIDTHDDAVVATIALSHDVGTTQSIHLAITPDGTRLLAVDENLERTGTLNVISTATNAVIAAIPVGERPTDVLVATDASRAYVVNHQGLSVSAISLADFAVTTVPVPDYPFQAALSPDGSRLYVTRFGSDGRGGVTILDTNTYRVVAAFDDEGGESFVHVTADGSKVFVTYYFPNEDGRVAVRIVAADTVNDVYDVISTLTGPAASAWLAMSADGRKGYLVSSVAASSEALDGVNDRYTGALSLPGPGAYPIWDPSTGRVFTPHISQNIVSVLDDATETIVETFATGSQPSFITIAAGKKYVSNRGDGTVSVIGRKPRARTSTTVSSSSTTAAFGQAMTLTATVKGEHGVPDGGVEFFDGSASLGSANLAKGTASLTVRLTAGSHVVTAVYGGTREDEDSTSPAITVKVTQASGTITLAAIPLTQYSDSQKFTATFTPASAGGPGPARICFKVGAQAVGCAPTTRVANGYQATWSGQFLESTPGNGQMKPGAHGVVATVDDPNVGPVSAARSISICKEDAQVTYSGVQSFALNNRSTGTVELTAKVTDNADGFRGDVRNALVSFIDRSTGLVIGSASVTECDDDCTTGTARINWNVNLGSAKSKTYSIGFLVTNYYNRYNTLDNATIRIARQ